MKYYKNCQRFSKFCYLYSIFLRYRYRSLLFGRSLALQLKKWQSSKILKKKPLDFTVVPLVNPNLVMLIFYNLSLEHQRCSINFNFICKKLKKDNFRFSQSVF